MKRNPAAVTVSGTMWAASLAILVSVLALLVPLVLRAAPAVSDRSSTPVDKNYLAAGGDLYDKQCAACHQPNGKGVDGTFPPLAGNPNLSDLGLIVKTVRTGHSGKIKINGKVFDQTMPAIGADFTAEEVAKVATYVRNSWGNEFGGVSLHAVKQLLNLSRGQSPQQSAIPVDGALLKEGQKLYGLQCASCHKADGKGVPRTFPPLADNPTLSGAAFIITTIRSGHSGKITINGKAFDQIMPAIGAGFTAEQLAAVATYIRNSWGNDFGGVSAAEVKRLLPNKSSGE